MAMRLFAVLTLSATFVVGTLAGCSSSDDAPAQAAMPQLVSNASGSRLRAKIVTGGGARQAVGFHDVQRNEDCTFQQAEGGRMRCLPASVPNFGASAFADAACTMQVVGAAPGCGEAPAYAITFDASGVCKPPPLQLRKLLPVSGPVYVQGPTGCTVQPGVPASANAIRAVGDVVPWTDFVEGKETVVPADGVSERVLLGDDGSRQHLGFRSEELGTSCSFETMDDGVTRCLPETARGPALYGDETCTKPLAVQYGTSCVTAERPFWLDALGAGKCRDIRAVYSVSSSFRNPGASDVIELHQRSSDDPLQCNSGTSYTLSIVGAGLRSIDADVTATIPAFSRVRSGAERLVPALVADADKPELVPGWHDTERNVDCRFTLAGDGKLRCLPTSTGARLFFTDGVCKAPSRVVVLSEVSCTGASGFAVVKGTTCPAGTRVFALTGEPHDIQGGSTETAPGRCVSFPALQKVYDATEVDPSQFVEGTALTE